MKKQKGFTLIEVMTTVAIVAILAAIAVPSYNDYVIRGKIPEATSELSSRRVQSEQHFQDVRTYETPITIPGPPPVTFINHACDAISGKNFDFDCVAPPTPNAYTIRAVGKGQMAGFTYTINQNNQKVSTIAKPGWTGNPTCWALRKDGSC